jgi:RHS repeat-associated protein
MNGKGTNVQYGYDDYGNLVSDPYKEITDISYNHLNLPVKITFGGGGKIEYFYDATGLKLKKKVTDGTTITTTDYMDGFQYTNGKLDFFPHAEGYAKAIPSGLGGSTSYTFKYVFSYTDHLGNIRVKYAQNPANGNQIEILEEDHYYPYGLKHNGYNGNHTTWDVTPGGQITLTPVNPFLGDTYKYGFNGKETNNDLGLNVVEMDFRQYDPALGRFYNIDEMTESLSHLTPYHFSNNNPVFFNDPSGLYPNGSNNLASTVVNDEGEVIDHRDDGDTNIYLNSRSGPVIGQEEKGVEYKKGDKIFNVDNSNPDYSLFSLITNSAAAATSAVSVGVYNVPKEILVYDETGKVVGRWITNIKVPFKALKLVNGVLQVVGPISDAVSVTVNTQNYIEGNISTGKYAYNMTGTVESLGVAYAAGGPAGVLVGSTFYLGEMIYDSYQDKGDPDRNPNTIHSVGEFFDNLHYLFSVKNLMEGFSRGW